MSFYDDMQDLAGELLGDFDQGGLSLNVYTPGGGPEYDPQPATYTPQPFSGAVRGVGAEYARDALVESTDYVVTMPGTLSPQMEDTVTVDGDEYGIVKITPKPAAGTVAAFEVVIRA